MSRLTGGNASWPQTDPYIMRFAHFAPHWPGAPAVPSTSRTAGNAGEATTGVSHHHPAAAWAPSPGPFGILPHQESVPPAPSASSASYGFPASAKSSLHHRHHPHHTPDPYLAAAMTAAAHDPNYNRYVNQHMLGMNSMSSRSPATPSSASVRTAVQHQVHPHHPSQYQAMNSFPGSERLARDLMSSSAAVYSQHQSSHHQNNNVVGMDPNAVLMQSSWYSAGMVPRMPVMSQRMPSSSGHQSRRGNEIVAGSGPSGAAGFAWSSYPGAAHNQSIGMHQSHHSSKYPVPGVSSASAAYHSGHSTAQQSAGRSHSGGSNNNHQMNHPSNSFNNYLSNCGMQMMNGLSPSVPLLPSAVSSHGVHHHQQQQQHHHSNHQHASANYSANNNNGNGASMSTSPADESTPTQSSNSIGSGSNNSNSSQGSRSSSVTPNHNLPVGQGADACSFSGYNSPSGNSVHNSYSPYQGRGSNSANNSTSSHTPTPAPHGPSPVVNQPVVGDAVSSYDSNGANSGYSSGGSGTSQGYAVMAGSGATIQRLTPPSSGYPTPPASVSQAQVVATAIVAPGEDSSHGLHSHFPLTPQSGSSYYSSSSGYSSNSKCSTDSVVSASSTSGASTSGNSCMVAAAAAAAAAYPAHLHSMSGDSGVSEAAQSSCLSGLVDGHHAKGMNPGPVSIAGGEADPNLGSVYTEQEIEFPSISYGSEQESVYPAMKVSQQSTPKKRKEKSKKDKKKKEKAKQVAAADRIALSSFAPFDVPVPHFSHQHLNTFPGQGSLASSLVMSSYLIPNPHPMDQADPMSHISSGSSFFNNGVPSDMLNQPSILTGSLQTAAQMSSQVTQQMTSHHQQQLMSQQDDPALHAPTINNVPSQDQRLQEKDTFADLEDDLRLLTEGTSSAVCQATSQQVTLSGAPPAIDATCASTTGMQMASFTSSSDSSQSNPQPQLEQHSSFPAAANVNGSTSDANPLSSHPGLSVAAEMENDRTSAADDLLDFIQKSSEHENHDPSTFNPGGSSVACSTSVASAESAPCKKKKKKSKDTSKEKSEKVKKLSGQQKAKSKPEEPLSATPGEAYETHIPIIPQQGKSSFPSESSPALHFDKKIAAASAAAGDTKFFKNRPQNVIPVTEMRTDSVTPSASICVSSSNSVSRKKEAVSGSHSTTTSRKRKGNDEIKSRNQLPHDEYEFRESPSEPSRKRTKKSISSPAAPPVTPKAGKKSSLSTACDKLPLIAPSPVITSVPSIPTTNGKKQPAKSAKTITSKSIVKTEPLARQASNPVKSPVSSLKCDNNRSTPGCATAVAAAPPAAPKLVNKAAANHVAKQVQHETDSVKDLKPLTSSAAHSKPQSLKSCDTPASVVQPAAIPKPCQPNGSSRKENSKVVNVAVQSMGTNTPRRRSQDKKALTIKEGLMRTGDFVVSIDEMVQELPMIWRIEGKSLLQRFEPSQQDGVTVYTNTSSYSAWNPTVRQRYRGVDVRIMGCSRTRIVVEKLGLTKNHPSANQNGDVVLLDKTKPPSTTGSSFQHQENFEVFIQTLISQALDPNFIAEIVKENDDYFLTHVQAIDKVCEDKKQLFFTKVKWDASIVKCIETFPRTNVIPQKNENDLRCRLCHDNWSTLMFNFTGDAYDGQTLEQRDVPDIKQTKYAACDACKDRVLLFSRLHHSKYNFYTKCQEKVEEMRTGDETKESHLILEQCLQDNDWILSLFHELEDIWYFCDKFTEITKIR